MKCPCCGENTDELKLVYEAILMADWDIEAGDWSPGTSEIHVEGGTTYRQALCPLCGGTVARGHRAVRKYINGLKATTQEG